MMDRIAVGPAAEHVACPRRCDHLTRDECRTSGAEVIRPAEAR